MSEKFDFNALRYPWDKEGGTELHLVLVETFPSIDDLVEIVEGCGLKSTMLSLGKPLHFLWRDTLGLASRKGKLEDLINTAVGFAGEKSSLGKLVEELKAGNKLTDNNEPRNPDGTANFLGKADEKLSKEEALLFKDDLTMEVGKLPALIKTLQLLEELVPAVCNLSVGFAGGRQHGTGFRIGDDLLLTNWHVVHDKQGNTATDITAIFGFEDNGFGKINAGQSIECSAANITSDQNNDWAVVTVVDKLDDNWPTIKLSGAVKPEFNKQAFIIQHPKNESKRLGYVRNRIADINDARGVVQYLTDTQEGSSGAPVLNADGKLIALHRAGGSPQKIPGLPPVKMNEGVLISVIRDALVQKGVQVP